MNNIINLLKEYNITKYRISPDGFIDVDEDVDFSGKNLTEIPFKIRTINGNFYCNDNQLKTFKNFPTIINGNCYCYNNKLSNFKNSPLKCITGDFFCNNNKLNSLVGSPTIMGNIDYSYNELTSIKGIQTTILEYLFIHNNKIKSLGNYLLNIKGKIHSYNNKIKKINEFYEDKIINNLF